MSFRSVTPSKSDLLLDAARRSARYVSAERDRAVFPGPAAVDGLEAFGLGATLDRPLDPEAVIAMLDEVGGDATVASTGGRYFGFVTGGVEPVGLAAAVLAGAWDQNAALPVMSPVAAHLDGLAAEWIVDLLGLPADAVAAFCAGATVANLTAIITARDTLLRRIGWDTAADGLMGAPPIDIVASAEAHSSIRKALRLSGLGDGSVHEVPTDEFGRMQPDEIPQQVLGSDRPALVLLQAGNVDTGHSDPFDAVVERFDAESSWIHVDGAFGLWANAVPDRRQLIDGVELADSWATDGHKWLNTPYDCGIVVIADPTALSRSMGMNAAYAGADGSRGAMNLGVQMSQRARAIPVWAILASLGRSGVAEAIERCCRHAERFATELDAAGVDVLCPPALNQVLVAFGDDERTDAVIARVQAGGEAWMGATTWRGRRAMRISVADTSTTDDDVDRAIAAVLAAR